MDLNALCQEMIPLVRQAGAIALKHFRNVAAERKADRSYVTSADREVEEYLVGEIRRRFPTHGVIGEEHGAHQLDAEYIWAIDPVDGTEPFVLEMPVWAVSVGLISREGALAGFVYLPVIDHLFHAIRGGAAYDNGQVIQVHPPCSLEAGTTLVGPSSTFHHFNTRYQGRVLSYGSAAAHLVFAARGKLHGGVFEKINLYDIAGGGCILEAAGGVMRYLSGDDIDLWQVAMAPDHKTREAMVVGHPDNAEPLRELFSMKTKN